MRNMSVNIRTTINPGVVITVSDTEYVDLSRQGLVYSVEGGYPVDMPDFTDAQYAELMATTGSMAHDTFAGKIDGLLTGRETDTRHSYLLRDNSPTVAMRTVGGALTHTLLATASPSAAYAEVNIGERVGRIWAEFEIPAGAGTAESLVLVVSSAQFTTPPDFAASAAHFVINATSWSYQTLDYPFATPVIIGGNFASPLAESTRHRVSIDFDGTTAIVTLPDGRTEVAGPNAKILSQRGNYGSIELFASVSNVAKAIKVHAWGVDGEKVAQPSYVTRADVGKALASRPVGATADMGSTAEGNISVGTSPVTIDTVSIVIPASRRIWVQAHQYMEPQATLDIYMMFAVDGNPTFGFTQLVHKGSTAGGAKIIGGVLDLSAFVVGSIWTLHVMAYTSTSTTLRKQDGAAGIRNSILAMPLP